MWENPFTTVTNKWFIFCLSIHGTMFQGPLNSCILLTLMKYRKLNRCQIVFSLVYGWQTIWKYVWKSLHYWKTVHNMTNFDYPSRVKPFLSLSYFLHPMNDWNIDTGITVPNWLAIQQFIHFYSWLLLIFDFNIP